MGERGGGDGGHGGGQGGPAHELTTVQGAVLKSHDLMIGAVGDPWIAPG